jgi:histone H3/H4
MQLRKKTTRRMMKAHLNNVQIASDAVMTMQEAIEEFVEAVCIAAKELLDEDNSLRMIQHMDIKKRLSSSEVSKVVENIIRPSVHMDNNLKHQEVEDEEVTG